MKRFLISAVLLVAGVGFVFVLLPMLATKLLAAPDKVATSVIAALVFGAPTILAVLLASRTRNKLVKFSAITFAILVILFAGAALTPESVLESETFLNIGTCVILVAPVVLFVWLIYRFIKWFRSRSRLTANQRPHDGTSLRADI